MDDFIKYCEDVYVFYNDLQKIFHEWWYKSNIIDDELQLSEPISIDNLIKNMDYLKEKQSEISFPKSQDFFIRNSKKQIDLIFKAANIQISILAGKNFDPIFLRNELYGIDIEKWFKIANNELENSFESLSEKLGKERLIYLIAKSGEGEITGEDKVNQHVRNFMQNATSKIDNFECISLKNRHILKKNVDYKVEFDNSSNFVMRVTPGERTLYFDPNYQYSNIFLDFVLAHDYCGHVFHDVLSNEVLAESRPPIFQTWFDDEFDIFSSFGEGMSCFSENIAPSFLNLNEDVVDYVNIRKKIWLPLRVVLDMKINIQKVPLFEVKEYMRKFDFPEDFIEYNIKNVIFHKLGYLSVYYPALNELEELQSRSNINIFNFYQMLLTAGNIPLSLFEEYLMEKIGQQD